jgi:hypothetical protein
MTVAMALFHQAVAVAGQVALALLVLVQQAVTVVMPHQIQSAGQRLLMQAVAVAAVKVVLLERVRAAVAMVQIVGLLMVAMQQQIVVLVVAVLVGVAQAQLGAATAALA